MKDDSLLYWIWLSLCCGPASPYANLLCDRFGNRAEEIYHLPQAELDLQLGLPDPLLRKLKDKDLSEASAILDWCRTHGVRLLHPELDAYPDKLRSIERMPLLLYYRGTLPDFDSALCIGMVGTRRMTEYGKHIAYAFSHDLAKAGVITISGMAAGIDGMIHRATLDAGGKTVAVLGCGIDRAYPAYHSDLMDEIAWKGAVLTEYKPFTKPYGANFPLRNRIISALSQGVAVIEADTHSGALITARYALYQGKDLFAIPGKVGETNSDGVHQLIKDGAKLVTKSKELLQDYLPLYQDRLHPERMAQHEQIRYQPMRSGAVFVPPSEKKEHRRTLKQLWHRQATKAEAPETLPAQKETVTSPKQTDISGLSETERTVYEALGEQTWDADTLCRTAKLPASDVSLALTLLEIKQLIQALPGGLYRRL